MAQMKYRDIDAYLADVAPEARRRINAVRKLVKAEVTDAREVISYNIPSFKTSKVFMHVAAFKEHIGVCPPVRADKRLMLVVFPCSAEIVDRIGGGSLGRLPTRRMASSGGGFGGP